jgi:hypothetical protein
VREHDAQPRERSQRSGAMERVRPRHGNLGTTTREAGTQQ